MTTKTSIPRRHQVIMHALLHKVYLIYSKALYKRASGLRTTSLKFWQLSTQKAKIAVIYNYFGNFLIDIQPIYICKSGYTIYLVGLIF
jgi:hypothetical protein